MYIGAYQEQCISGHIWKIETADRAWGEYQKNLASAGTAGKLGDMWWLIRIGAIVLLLFVAWGCQALDIEEESRGAAGADGQSCVVSEEGDGSYTIDCPGSAPLTISDGADGAEGATGVQGA